MHGLIFIQLQKFAQQQAGAGAWETLLREAELPVKSYSPARAYPDEEVLALVGAASRVLKLPAAAILEAFGEFIAPELIRLYGRLLQPEWKTLDVIENTERLIHATVRIGNPGAQPPVLECIRTTQDALQIMYASKRQLCCLAKGIVTGLGRYFGESITVTDDACMMKGDPFCALRVERVTTETKGTGMVSATETAIFQESTAFTGGFVPQQSVVMGSLGILKPPLQRDELGRLADFRVLQLIGQGGMGIVFRADDTRLSRVVALKIMHPRLAAESNMRQRFLREAKAMAAIKSDYVVTIYEVGVVNDLPFLAMELLEGESLETYHEKNGRLPLHQVVRIGLETARGLAAAHARGLIHRDIKPGNLWLESPSGRTKILDFGLARTRDSAQLSQAGAVLGTPAFMAPEQARAESVDHRVDLFSLGCVLYWLCTNEHPFKGTDILSTLTSLATYDPHPPLTISTDVPADLSDLVMQLLQKDPGRRPASSQVVADQMAAIEHSLGNPTGVTVPSPKP